MIETESPRYVPPKYVPPTYEIPTYVPPTYEIPEIPTVDVGGIIAGREAEPTAAPPSAIQYDIPEFQTREEAVAEVPTIDVAARMAESEVYQPPVMQDFPTREEALAEIDAQTAEMDARFAVIKPELGTRLKVQREEEKKPQSQIRTDIKARREEFIKRLEAFLASHEGDPNFERFAVFLRRFIGFLKNRGADIKITNESEIRNRSPGEHISAKFQIKNRRSDRDLNVRVKATDQEGRTIREIEVPALKRNEARNIELGFIVPAKVAGDYSPVRFAVSEIFEEVI